MTGAFVIIGGCAALFALLWRRTLRQLDEAREEIERQRTWATAVVAECDERREIAACCIACRGKPVRPAHERVQEVKEPSL